MILAALSLAALGQWLDGPNVIRFTQPVPVGHYLGPGDVIATGTTEHGVVTILGPELWFSGEHGIRHVRAGESCGSRAKSLSVASVSDWKVDELSDALSTDELDRHIQARGSRLGWATGSTIPYWITGDVQRQSATTGHSADVVTPAIAGAEVVTAEIVGFTGQPPHLVLRDTQESAALGAAGLMPGAVVRVARPATDPR